MYARFDMQFIVLEDELENVFGHSLFDLGRDDGFI